MRERIRKFLRVTTLILTGTVVLVPLRDFLTVLIGKVARFTAAQISYGEVDAPADLDRNSQHPHQVSAENLRARGGFHLNRFIAALILTILSAVFLFAELQLNKPYFDAILGLSGEHEVLSGMTWASALTLCGAMVFWGIILLDLYGFTHFLPLFTDKLKPLLRWTGFTCLGLGLATAGVMGIWRGEQLALPITASDALAEPSSEGGLVVNGQNEAFVAMEDATPNETILAESSTGFDHFGRVFPNYAVGTLALASAIVSFTGVFWLLRYVALIAIALLLAGPALVRFLLIPAWDSIVGHVLEFNDAVIDGIADSFSRPRQAKRNSTHGQTAPGQQRVEMPAPPVAEPKPSAGQTSQGRDAARPAERETASADAVEDELRFDDLNWGDFAPDGGTA